MQHAIAFAIPILNVILATCIVVDARRRQANAVAWGIATLMFGILAGCVYLLFRPRAHSLIEQASHLQVERRAGSGERVATAQDLKQESEWLKRQAWVADEARSKASRRAKKAWSVWEQVWLAAGGGDVEVTQMNAVLAAIGTFAVKWEAEDAAETPSMESRARQMSTPSLMLDAKTLARVDTEAWSDLISQEAWTQEWMNEASLAMRRERVPSTAKTEPMLHQAMYAGMAAWASAQRSWRKAREPSRLP